MGKRILPPDAIVELRAAAQLRRTLTNKALARKYNVSPCTIRNVLNEDSYKRKLARRRKRKVDDLA